MTSTPRIIVREADPRDTAEIVDFNRRLALESEERVLDATVVAPVDARATFDGSDATASLASCFNPGSLRRGGSTLSCPIPRGLLTEGDHVLQVVITDAQRAVRRNAVRYSVVGGSR